MSVGTENDCKFENIIKDCRPHVDDGYQCVHQVDCKVTDTSNQTPSQLITFLTKNSPSLKKIKDKTDLHVSYNHLHLGF